jgi:cytochrome b involved in lipid metabolism
MKKTPPASRGYSQVDWLKNKNKNGRKKVVPLSMEQVKQHNRKDDAWLVLRGKVYDVTEYIPFHPGGEAEICRAIGKDATKLFLAKHPWVNAEFLLSNCLVGYLVEEKPVEEKER